MLSQLGSTACEQAVPHFGSFADHDKIPKITALRALIGGAFRLDVGRRTAKRHQVAATVLCLARYGSVRVIRGMSAFGSKRRCVRKAI